jgi:hypothetical protein
LVVGTFGFEPSTCGDGMEHWFDSLVRSFATGELSRRGVIKVSRCSPRGTLAVHRYLWLLHLSGQIGTSPQTKHSELNNSNNLIGLLGLPLFPLDEDLSRDAKEEK